ncbi:hypothetical protein SALBM311S_10680 [Streptomyces alboniger]
MNPDRALRREVIAREWPILDFHWLVRLKQRFPAFSVPPRSSPGRSRGDRRRGGHRGARLVREPAPFGSGLTAPASTLVPV